MSQALASAIRQGSIEAIEAKVASGDFEGAVLTVLVDIAGMEEEQVEAVRSSSVWPDRLATAPTIAREARIEANWVLEPGQFNGIAAPTLLLSGSESPPELGEVVHRSAEAIPGSRIAVLDGARALCLPDAPSRGGVRHHEFCFGCLRNAAGSCFPETCNTAGDPVDPADRQEHLTAAQPHAQQRRHSFCDQLPANPSGWGSQNGFSSGNHDCSQHTSAVSIGQG